MSEFEAILLPVDLEPACESLVRHVKAIAEAFEPEVHLLFVTHRFRLSRMFIPGSEIYASGRERAVRRLEEFRNRHFAASPNIKTSVVAGVPSEGIISYAQTERSTGANTTQLTSAATPQCSPASDRRNRRSSESVKCGVDPLYNRTGGYRQWLI